MSRRMYPAAFERFWSIYPRRTAKLLAWRRFEQEQPDLEAVAKDVDRKLFTGEWDKDQPRYIPLPATYLHQRRWEDAEVDETEVVSFEDAKRRLEETVRS